MMLIQKIMIHKKRLFLKIFEFMKRKCQSSMSSKKENKTENGIRVKVNSTDSSIGPYIYINEIGKGTFSSVIKVKRPDIPKCYFACKIVSKKEIQENKEARISFEREVRINHQLHHPGHVELVDLLSDDQHYYMIMQYCPGGTLLDFIQKHRKPIQEEKAKPLFRQLIETVDYLQKMGVSHRDLKLENILFNQSNKLVIADFGLSRFVEQPTNLDSKQSRRNLVKSRCGSVEYASPEVVSGGKENYDGFASDVWSCGVILFGMLTKRLPWKKTEDVTDTMKQIINGDYQIPTNVSAPCQDLIKRMMTLDPGMRITVPEILDHEWLKNVPKQFDISKETVYNSISLKMIDNFFEVDALFEEKSNINCNDIYKCCSKNNLIFEQQSLELEKSFNNEEFHPHVPKGLRPSKIIIPKSSQKFSDSQHFQPIVTPSPKWNYPSPGANQVTSPNMNQSLLNIEKIHIVKPPELNKPAYGARGRHHQKLRPLRKELKISTDLKDKEQSKDSSGIIILPPQPPSNSPKSPKSYRRPIKKNTPRLYV